MPTSQESFDKLKVFFETRPASAKAASSLKKDVEIGIVLAGPVECAFFKEDGKPRFEQRAAHKPDVIFEINPDAVDALVAAQTEDVGELGINLLKSYMAGNVRIKVVGSMMNLLMRGYLGVIKEGGISFSKYLASHGLNSLGKIKDAISKMKK